MILKATKSIVMMNSIKIPRTTFASSAPTRCFVAKTKIEIHEYNILMQRSSRRIVTAGKSFEMLVNLHPGVEQRCIGGISMKGLNRQALLPRRVVVQRNGDGPILVKTSAATLRMFYLCCLICKAVPVTRKAPKFKRYSHPHTL